MLKTTGLAIAAACTLFAACVARAESPQTFMGSVTDTMCGSKPHSSMLKDKTAPECVRVCTHGPHEYALFDGTAVMKFSDQKTPAQYAGQEVRVTGVYDEKSKTLKVTSIAPANGAPTHGN
jgi:hypothetical protein